MRPRLLFIAADRVDRSEIGKVPARDPSPPEVQCQTPALLRRGVREVKAAQTQEL
jgi:hypothetical protein